MSENIYAASDNAMRPAADRAVVDLLQTPKSHLMSGLTYLGYATATPYVIEYTAAAAGKMANYALRWVNSRGDKGPWSRTVSATVSA